MYRIHSSLQIKKSTLPTIRHITQYHTNRQQCQTWRHRSLRLCPPLAYHGWCWNNLDLSPKDLRNQISTPDHRKCSIKRMKWRVKPGYIKPCSRKAINWRKMCGMWRASQARWCHTSSSCKVCELHSGILQTYVIHYPIWLLIVMF